MSSDCPYGMILALYCNPSFAVRKKNPATCIAGLLR